MHCSPVGCSVVMLLTDKGIHLRSSVASAVRSSKNKWLQEKAQSIQDALAQGRLSVVWQDIHAILE